MSSREADSSRVHRVLGDPDAVASDKYFTPDALARAYHMLSIDIDTRAFGEESRGDPVSTKSAEKDRALSQRLDNISNEISSLTEVGLKIYAYDLSQFQRYRQGIDCVIGPHLENPDGPSITYDMVFINLAIPLTFGRPPQSSRPLQGLHK